MRGAADGKFLLVGVMSGPANKQHRLQQREWRKQFKSPGTEVKMVLGSARLNGTVSMEEWTRREQTRYGDLLYVDGRDGLPNIGQVTEKSASWWRTIAERAPEFRYYCKSDDDTYVHLDRLEAVLRHVERRLPGRPVYFGHVKWRGWDVGHRFQACGGGWGPYDKTMTDMLKGTLLHTGGRGPPCVNAAGPYPYMSGGMVCMSRPLALVLAHDAAFADFYAAARGRNSVGVPCRSPVACSTQPEEVKMWHHEDAGIGFNVFRAAALANSSIACVAAAASAATRSP